MSQSDIAVTADPTEEVRSDCGKIRFRGRSLCHVDLRKTFGTDLDRLPWILRILAENALRHAEPDDRERLRAVFLQWLETGSSQSELEIWPGRLMMHDTTCIPALVDLAALRDAVAEAGGDPERLNPVLPVDVSVDHSLSVQHFGTPDAAKRNLVRECALNAERYRMMKWATKAMGNIRVHPPGTGIMHTINLEQLATVITIGDGKGASWITPDLMLGTDSHTPMVNGIGVLAWGVGGLEAESVMFGLPVTLKLPDIVGVRLTGALPDGVVATDLALTVTERLRRLGVSGEYVEFFGPGVSTLSAGDRAVVANMAPEFGASSGYFAIDGRTLDYLRATNRAEADVELVERGADAIGISFDPDLSPVYSKTIEIDLGKVSTTLAGPRRPQDRVLPACVPKALERAIGRPLAANDDDNVPDGAVAIAAITSCTNTSSPELLVAAGLLAREAVKRGLRPPHWVKTSFAPGSPSAGDLLRRAGLLEHLEEIGFGIVGHGCTTCIGNSGPLPPAIIEALGEGRTAVAVLSGNRNFSGRVHPELMDAFLASPALVVAYGLAGDVDRDIFKDPLGNDRDGRPVFLPELWPSADLVEHHLRLAARPSDYTEAFAAAEASEEWNALDAPSASRFPWGPGSTYLRPPPFASTRTGSRLGSYTAYPLLVLGDDITTDHISPAGQIAASSEAGEYLLHSDEAPDALNVFASRRGNWEVMVRGLFTNRGVRNLLDPGLPAGWTVHVSSGKALPLYRAAEEYASEGQSVVVIAGERYGAGSSRDWAAKGLALLGVRAVLAKSFERIHRTNLVGMGILPIRLPQAAALDLRPGDQVFVPADEAAVVPRATIAVRIDRADGASRTIDCLLDVQTVREAELLKSGGVLPMLQGKALAR